MRMDGGFCMYTFIPGMCASFGISFWMISSAERLRWLLGFSTMKTVPVLSPVRAPPAPTDDIVFCTLGSRATIAAACFW